MTRVPKFRAWDKTVDEMVDVDEMQWTPNKNGVMEFFGIGNFIPCGLLAREVEIMQSTGLKDKNGVEIFEMDVVSLSGSLYTVAYDSENGAYKMLSHDKRWVDDYILTYTTTESLTVVGNVYENKEILE